MEKRIPDDQNENLPREIPNRPDPEREYPTKDPIPDAEPGKDNPVNPQVDEPTPRNKR